MLNASILFIRDALEDKQIFAVFVLCKLNVISVKKKYTYSDTSVFCLTLGRYMGIFQKPKNQFLSKNNIGRKNNLQRTKPDADDKI